jgi:hypothetical protein
MAINTPILKPFDRAPDLHEAFYRKVGIPAAAAAVRAMAKPVELWVGLKRVAWTTVSLSV